jgi:hypothetical protein
MKDRSARPKIELTVGDEYQIFTHQEDVVYRHVPREPKWWRGATDEQRQAVVEFFDSDDVFTLTLEIAGFMALDQPTIDDMARLVRNQWALSWMAEVAALVDDPFTQDDVILVKTIGHHRLVAVAQMGAHAGYRILESLPTAFAAAAAQIAEESPFDVVEIKM